MGKRREKNIIYDYFSSAVMKKEEKKYFSIQCASSASLEVTP